MAFKINWDVLGITTSVACAIHCAVLPLLLTSPAIFGVSLVHNVLLEYAMIFIALAIGVYSLYHGFRKHHHRLTPLVIFLLGITFLFAKQRWHEAELWLLIPAVIAIVAAHFYNYRYCKKANHCHSTDCDHGTRLSSDPSHRHRTLQEQ
ncbi:MAG: MerC domain-containing protein [Chitinophagaceae bacterium]|nr:MerC domain-containing protein [Chitinophagaceae bacterium]